MERTMFFSDWVAEYKPIEFHEVGPVELPRWERIDKKQHIANRAAYNKIRKYLTYSLEFPSSHMSKVDIMKKAVWSPITHLYVTDTEDSPNSVLMSTMSLSAWLVTKKPWIDIEDKIIIDFSKKYNKFKIQLTSRGRPRYY